MSYEKQTWTNNVSSIDETKMNHIEDGIESIDLKTDNIKDTKGTIIPTATARVDSMVTMSQADTFYDVPLGSITHNNSSFTLSNGGIVCPFSGNILATASLQVSPRKGYVTVTIMKNNSNQHDAAFPSGGQNWGVIETANRMISVTAGDIISFKVKSTVANDRIETGNRSRLTVFYVNTV